MSGAMLAPWDPGEVITLQNFPALLHRDRYLRIYEFLRDKTLVNDGIAALQAATAGMGQPGFRQYLHREERRFGFSPAPALIAGQAGLVKGSTFWTYLFRRQPMIDIGAGDQDHGVLTHRVQWVLIGQWNERAGLPLGPANIIGELYGNLGAGNARVLTAEGRALIDGGGTIDTGTQSGARAITAVWDALVDGGWPRQNATVPEYLRRLIAAQYQDLYARQRW